MIIMAQTSEIKPHMNFAERLLTVVHWMIYICLLSKRTDGNIQKDSYFVRCPFLFIHFTNSMTLWINLKLKMLSIISPLYKKDYATVKTICNISNACKHLNIGCISLIHFWIGTAGCMVNMQQFMKVTSILVAGSHSTTEFVTQFLFMNMVTDHFKELMQKERTLF